jgi:2-amino-4-hydroxy-6-hydroxymethyldihydropteridine diphosphokinase
LQVKNSELSDRANKVILHLGSNLGDPLANINLAMDMLSKQVRVVNTSSTYLTAAWGMSEQADFFNRAATISTSYSPSELLHICDEITKSFPEKKGERWGPRFIDVDIIFFGDEIIDTESIKIPHPRMHLRNFVLIPLLEIAPDWVHPILQKTVEELFVECHDELEVILLEA